MLGSAVSSSGKDVLIALLLGILGSSHLLVSSFAGIHAPFTHGSDQTTSSALKMSTSEIVESSSVGNIFQAYDKPIILIGSSSENGELPALAQFLSEKVKGSVIYPSANLDCQTFPDVMVLDFAQDDFMETAKKLYDDHNALSIYVNVQSTPDEPAFVKYSDYELCIKDEASNMDSEEWKHVEWELARLVARALLPPAIPGDRSLSVNTAHLTMGEHTFFLSLSFPSITEVEPFAKQMCADVDAMEYRTDLLDCRDSRFDVIYGMQLLRRYCRPHAIRAAGVPFGGEVIEDLMPTVYTVRTQNQAGTYPDDEAGIEKMFAMLEWGLRSGVEVLDVESAWSPSKTDGLLKLAKERYSSQILGSHHVVGKEISLEEAVELFENCALDGRAHGAKVVLSLEDKEKDNMAYQAALIAESLAESEGRPVIPNISLILGEIGQFSRIINIPFTPVTHESLPVKAAPGQMTPYEILCARILTDILKSRQYVILGHNIAYSVSPQMHGSAFQTLKLPYVYGRVDTEKVESFIESDIFKGENFAGCSVTIPHKQAIIPYVDVMSDAATAIGSVNTLTVKEEVGEEEMETKIYGDNTDWKGIFNPLRRKLPAMRAASSTTAGVCLILGAGGTARAAAYAAEKLGLQRLYYNRTPSKATQLAATFGGTVLESLEESGEGSLGSALLSDPGVEALKVVLSTLPAAAEFTLPDWVMANTSPIVFDVNYKPYSTKLLEQAENGGCDVVRGSEMLWEQGVGQFELWTGRTAPYKIMKDVVLENCLPTEEKSFQ